MTPVNLASVWAKFRRAKVHLEALKRDITTWRDTDAYRLTNHTSPDLTRHSWVISVLNPPDLEKWSLIASDVIHNLRCSLDHLVYAIAVSQTERNPPPSADVLAFPICDNPKLFRGAAKKLSDLSVCVRAEIEKVQPYHRPHERLPPLLGWHCQVNASRAESAPIYGQLTNVYILDMVA